MKRLLILGAGRVSAPLIRYFLSRRDARVLIASSEVQRAHELVEEYATGTVLQTDVSDPARLRPLIGEADIVVSLLPAGMHGPVAAIAIEAGVPFVSTSYQSPEISALDEQANAAGVLVLSETGLDPGLDHMSAARMVRDLKARGGRVKNFSSCCGGFPAPDSHNNPWGYKFSWNPKGVVLAGRMDARYLRDGEVVEIRGENLFEHRWRYEIRDEGIFEIYPNRDSLKYIELYGLDGVRGMFRGTIRYPGWCATMSAAARLGLFDLEVLEWPEGATYSQLLTRLVPGSGSLTRRVADFLHVDLDSDVITRLEWGGFFSDRPLGTRSAAAIDIFLRRLETMMVYEPGDRDMIALQHHFTAEFPDNHVEHHTSSILMTGESWGDSAMARSVALPAAIAARLILEGRLEATGCRIPVTPEIYEPMLMQLEEEGISIEETHSSSYPGPLD